MAIHNQLMPQIQDMLREILPENTPQVTMESDLMNDLNLDSLKVMELLEKLEDFYDISIPINILAGIRTVGDLVEEIRKLTAS